MTELQYRTMNNFGWHERDIRGRLLRDQIEALDYDFMFRLDNAITDAKSYYGSHQAAFIVYDFTLDEHNPKGYHPRGRAVDGAFRSLDLFQTFVIFDRWRFGGLGLYPDTIPQRIIHVDDRKHYRASRWVCRKINDEKTYIYSPKVFEDQLLHEAAA